MTEVMKRPIVCTALNPSIDKRLHVDVLQTGKVHRVSRLEATPGGKGLNVARVAKSLGAPVLATGFLGGTNGDWIRARLDALGIEQQWVAIGGETRICLNIIDDSSGVSTEVLEPGPQITADEADAFLKFWVSHSEPGQWMTLSGSLPNGLEEDYYYKLIRLARSRGAHVVLDTSGAPLARGIEAGPHTIKPNEQEFRQWTGSDPHDTKSVLRLAERLGAYGVQRLLITMGGEGCIAATPEGELWKAVPPRIRTVNAVGSGDSFVAGWTIASAKGMPLPEALRYAVAVGSANAMTPGTGEVHVEHVNDLFPRVQVSRLI